MKPLLAKRDGDTVTPAELDVFELALRKHAYEDPDEDGAYNIEELNMGTYPGDPVSTPDPESLKKYREYHPLPKSLMPPDPPPPAISPVKTIKPPEFPLEWLVAAIMLAAFSIIGWTKWRRLKTTP